jgi:hypothetical protein
MTRQTSRWLAAGLVLALGTSLAVAQTAPQTAPAAPTPLPSMGIEPQAVPDITNSNPAAPLPGANSFTEGQARDRLEANGFSEVTGLSKDDEGVWRGQASKNGATMSVAIDYQGNIIAK